MNERIRQLAEQAGLLGPSSRVGNSHEATEKFAEMIVRESAHVALMSNGNNLHVCELIKQHFGVEE